MPKINIAIDGFAGCGKSTLAKDLAQALNYTHIDSGAMYRALTFLFLKNKTDLRNIRKISQLLRDLDLRVIPAPDCNHLILNGEDVTSYLRTDSILSEVSNVAALPEVRKKLVAEQIKLADKKGIVMDGRDIGTVVLPKAELKIFLTARLEARVKRRKKELALLGRTIGYKQIEENLNRRDHSDSTRKESPLMQAEDAVLMDNTNLNREEQIAMVLALALYRSNDYA